MRIVLCNSYVSIVSDSRIFDITTWWRKITDHCSYCESKSCHCTVVCLFARLSTFFHRETKQCFCSRFVIKDPATPLSNECVAIPPWQIVGIFLTRDRWPDFLRLRIVSANQTVLICESTRRWHCFLAAGQVCENQLKAFSLSAILDMRAGTFTQALVANIMEKQERHRLTMTILVYCVAA